MTAKRKYKANREDWGRIRPLKSGRFQASYLGPDGVTYPGLITYTSKADARAWLSEIRRTIERGTWKSPKAASAEVFGTYAATWVAQRTSSKGEPLRPKTKSEYLRQLDKGLSVFTNDRISTLTPARIRTWHADRMKSGATQAGAEARLLRAILSTAVEDGLLTTNPVPSKLTKSSTGKNYRPPTLEELSVIVATIGDRYKLGVLLGAYGGLRLSEWRALRRSDLQLIDGRYVVTVTRQAQYIRGEGWVVGEPKSEKGKRPPTLPSWMTPEVDAHLEARVGPFPESLLFAPRGKSEFIHDSDFNNDWNPARDAAGVRGVVREHDLRDFAGSHFMAAGANIIETRDFLGHASSATTEKHYLHVVNDRAAELADRMPQLPKAKTAKITKLTAKMGS